MIKAVLGRLRGYKNPGKITGRLSLISPNLLNRQFAIPARRHSHLNGMSPEDFEKKVA
jgi:hypothetical protein